MKSTRRWEGHVARIGDMRNKYWSENMTGGDHSEDLGKDGKVWIGTNDELL